VPLIFRTKRIHVPEKACHSVDRTRAPNPGFDTRAYDDALRGSGEALAWLVARYRDGALPLLQLPGRRDDLAAIREAGGKLAAGATDIVILGTGGSSLGGQTLAQLAGHAVPGIGALRADHLDEQSLGELLMQFMLETIIAAHLLGVDPFDQPAVEEGKVLAKQYLAGER